MGVYTDQVGFLPKFPKVISSTFPGKYALIRAYDGAKIAEKEAVYKGMDEASGDEIWQIDFSEITEEGIYCVGCKEYRSDLFRIGEDVYQDLEKALIKALYFQRCGCELKKEHAGIYTHKACHTKPVIMLQDYLDKVADPKTYLKCGGWHDAGDYGRYTTAAAVAVAHLLYAYELFPESFQAELNIPESGNGIPDVLNECRYELDWLITMQFEDGSVSHKLTAFRHADFLMPEEDHDPFLIYQASSVAAADYAAVFALASRIYRPFDAEFADRALAAARRAFAWLAVNGNVEFKNVPGSGTGEYGDDDDRDERLWAAAELLRTDVEGDVASYTKMLEEYAFEEDLTRTDMGWTDVSGLALFPVLFDNQNRIPDGVVAELKKVLFTAVTNRLEIREKSGYLLSMEGSEFVWGSNMVVLNIGMLYVIAALLADEDSQKEVYAQAAADQLHYLLGRNALNRSYVTGFGEHAFHNPHNRPTACDGIYDPMPGWVSGGPFKTPVDATAKSIIPVGTPPMKCHADEVGSYSTNEITIYWNSPAVFLTAFLNEHGRKSV